MDRRLLKAKISKWIYKMTYPPGFYKNYMTVKFPSLARRLDRTIMRGDDMVVLPGNKLVNIDQAVSETENVVLPTDLIDHFIDASGYRCVMDFCICRDSNKCKDYPMELGCLFLGEAARSIHPDLCHAVSKEDAKAHVRKCQDAGLVQMVGKGKFDTLWLDAYPGSQLFTICNCCPCCCISLAFPYLSPMLRKKVSRLPGVSMEVTDDCIGCGKCLDVCIYNGIGLDDDRALINNENCLSCGRCATACSENAIQVKIENNQYVEETIGRLASKVDVT